MNLFSRVFSFSQINKFVFLTFILFIDVFENATFAQEKSKTSLATKQSKQVEVQLRQPIEEPPTIVVSVNPTSLRAGEEFEISWEATNTSSVSVNCTAEGTGFRTSETNLPSSGIKTERAQIQWVGFPSTCLWVAENEYGVESYSVQLVTKERGSNAQFVGQSIASEMNTSMPYFASVTMKNTGITTWRANSTFKLGAQNPQDNSIWLPTSRVVVAQDVLPGQNYTFNFEVVAPSLSGFTNFQWRMVEEGIEWFGESTANTVIDVRNQNDFGVRFDPTELDIVSKEIGLASGAVKTIVNLGKAPFTYEWSHITGSRSSLSDATIPEPTFKAEIATDDDFSEVWALKVTDSDGKVVVVNLKVNFKHDNSVTKFSVQVNPINLSLEKSSEGEVSGTLEAYTFGGTFPVSFNWTRTSGTRSNISDAKIQNPKITSTIAIGDSFTEFWQVEAKDAEGKTSTATVQVNFALRNQAESLSLEIVPSALVLSSIQEGTVSGKLSTLINGGKPPYSISWETYEPSPKFVISDNKISNPTFTIQTKKDERYSELWFARVVDAMDNEFVQSVFLGLSPNEPIFAATIQPSPLVIQPSDFGIAQNDLSVFTFGGKGPFNYYWTQVKGNRTKISDETSSSPSFSARVCPGDQFTERWMVNVHDSGRYGLPFSSAKALVDIQVVAPITPNPFLNKVPEARLVTPKTGAMILGWQDAQSIRISGSVSDADGDSISTELLINNEVVRVFESSSIDDIISLEPGSYNIQLRAIDKFCASSLSNLVSIVVSDMPREGRPEGLPVFSKVRSINSSGFVYEDTGHLAGISATVKTTNEWDGIGRVELREGSTVLAVTGNLLRWPQGGEVFINDTTSISLLAPLSVGHHRLYLRAYTGFGVIKDSDTFNFDVTLLKPDFTVVIGPNPLVLESKNRGIVFGKANVYTQGSAGEFRYLWTRVKGERSLVSNNTAKEPLFSANLEVDDDFIEQWKLTVTNILNKSSNSAILDIRFKFNTGPSLEVVRAPNPLIAGTSFTTQWKTNGANNVSFVCTADGSGFNGSGMLDANGTSIPTVASADWIGFPSTCVWTAVGEAGITTLTETMVTVEGILPTIKVNRTNPIRAGNEFITNWEAANADSLEYNCTANQGGYVEKRSIPIKGSSSRVAEDSWVANPSLCNWTAKGPGGTYTHVENFTTESRLKPSLLIAAPNAPPNTSTSATVIAGQSFTLRWILPEVREASLACTDGINNYDNAPVETIEGERTLYARPEWRIGRSIGCLIIASSNDGTQITSDMVWINVPGNPTIKVERTPNPLVVGKSFTTTWTTHDATSVSYSCTANGRGFKGAGTLPPNGSEVGTALAGWVDNPSTCTWTAKGDAGTHEMTEIMVTKRKPLPTITVTRTPTELIVGKSFKTIWKTTDATEVRYSCSASDSGFKGSATLNPNGSETGIALAGWLNNPSTCVWTAIGPGGEASVSEVMITQSGALPTIKVTRNPTTLIAGKNFSTKWITTDATSVQYSCTAMGSGFHGSTMLAPQGTSTATASADWVDYPSTCIWTATGPNGSTSITEILETDGGALPTLKITRTPNPLVAGNPFTTTWSSTKATSINYRCQADGNGMKSSGTLALSGSEDQTAQFDWVNSPSLCTWTASGPGGEREIKETVTTVNGSMMTVVLDSNVKHLRVPQGQTTSISFTGYGNFPTGRVRKLELFLDDGNGYALTPIKTITGNNIKLVFTHVANLSVGSYRLKLRATNQGGGTVDSTPLVVNVIDSPLLGEVSGIRSKNTGKLELFGWACQDNNSQGLNYAVYADAPSRLGGTQIASGNANLATANNQTQVSELCHTPNVGHHFVVDLSPFAIAYGGKRLFVEVATDNNALKATLPCADNNCTMPGAIRIGLTTPQNNDRYTGPAIVFMRAKIDNGNGIYDELAFNINNEWINATADSEAGTFTAMKVGVPSRDTPYPVLVKVRQGNSTIYSSENLIYVDAINNGVSLTITKPANNQTVNRGKVVDISAYANILQGSTAQIYSVKFYINDVFVANGVNAGNGNWNAQWTPAQMGAATLRAKAFDQGGAVLQTSSANQLVISDATGTVTGDLLPVNVNLLDLINKPDAGSLPGSLSVTPNGAASYSIPLDVPPGTAGVQPKISLDYSSQAQNSRVGLGWSLGGFSSIHRCGKTIAQDGVNGRIGFDLDDRLCLDGQRLVLVSGDTTNNEAYWADGAEFRTELESFTKIVATGAVGDAARAYEVRSKEGRISFYGGNNSSTVKAILGTPKSGEGAPQLSPKNGAQSWALNSVIDRSGNHIRYAYEQDGVTGEHRPKFIRYGGNGLTSHAAIEFTYEGRQDAWTRYIDETRNDLRSRLTQVKTYVGNNLDGSVSSAGTWVRETNLSYEYSPTSGRSLLQSVESCGRNPSNSARDCLPKTTFNWGKPDPAKTPGFVSRQTWNNTPIMTTRNGLRSANHSDYFAFADFENHGFTDVLEKRVASPGEPSNPERDSYIAANPIATGTLRNQYRYFHNTGNGFTQYPYRLDTNEAFAVLEIGDFDGNGAPDIVVATATLTKICISPLGNGIGARSEIVFTCASQQERPALGRNLIFDLPYVIDVKGDGRSALYSHISDRTATAKLYIQNQKFDDSQPPYSVLGYEFPYGAFEIPDQAYTSFTQMVDFSGTGKSTDVRWTIPRFRDYYSDGEGTHALMRWENLAPQISITSFRVPGTPMVGQMSSYFYPEYRPDCQRPECGPIAPYYFDAPYSGGSVSADFNGSGYSNLIFGFIEVTTNPVTRFNYASRAEMTLCLSTGRALDCGIRKKYSGTNYQTVRTVGNFVGDGQSSILVETTINLPDRQPVPQGDIQLCSVRGDDTTQGNGTNDTNLICTPWAGPKLPAPTGLIMAGNQVLFMDLLGTGRTQLVYYHEENGAWEVFEPTDLSKTGEALDRIVSVTNGLNATSTVTYADGVASGIVTQSGSANLVYPLRPSPNVGKIVSRIEHSNGISGTRRTSFRYEDAAIDVSGRGSLGFAKFIAIDENTGIKNTTSFKQGWPLTGMVDTHRSETTGSGAVTLVNTTNQWKSKSIPQNSGSTTFVYLEQSDTQLRDIKNFDLGRTETVSRYIDDFGNLNSQTVKVIGNNQTLTTDTNNSYRNDKTCWAIGLPLTTSVTKSDSLYAGSITRRIDRDYDTCKLLPLWETVEKGNAALELTTTFDRSGNPFGLVNRKTETWFDPDPANSGSKSRTSSISYDAKGRFIDTVTNALNHQESHVYDEGTGARTRLTGPNGLSTNWRINAFGRAIVELRADGNETHSYIRDCQGGCPLGATIVQISDQFYGANRTSVPQLSFSDNAGHLLRTQTWGFDGSIIVIDQTYDHLGRLENTYHPRFENAQAFKSNTFQYDLVDRVIESTNYDSNGETRRTTTSYDGYTTTMVNPRGQVRIETHNVAKQLVQVQDANNGFTKFSYDPFGNLRQTIDPENNVIVVDYDTLGRKTALNDPDLGLITYKVNPLGQTWAQVSPKQRALGQQTRFVFDKLGRMTGRFEVDLESHWIFDTAANGKGQLAEAYTGADNAAPSARTYRREHTYDEKGRPKKTTQSLRDASYANEVGYDTWGRALTLSYTRSNGPTKSFYHRYNNMGYLAKIERAGLILWQVMQQDASHRVTLASLGNGLTQNRVYNPYTARLDTASLNSAVGEARVQEGYQYDSLGNVESRQQYWSGAADGFQEQYTYDSLNRLETTTMNNDTIARQVFTYDKTGNIKRKPNVSSGEYVYPTQGAGSVRPHAVESIPGVGSFSYDANGNLENGAGRSITWKSFDMPYRITKGSQYSEFTYGPEHQRTYQTRNDGSKTEYAGAQEVETKDGILTIKTYWPGGLGVEIDKGNDATKLLWMHQDRLGSQIAITDETGMLKEKLAYDAWGKRMNLNGIGTPDDKDGVIDNKGYTGHEMLDQLDLVHMNGRVYDPLVARFVSADPILQDPMNGQSYNRFAYVLNNPTNLTDPTGFASEGCAGRIYCSMSYMVDMFGSFEFGGKTHSIQGSNIRTDIAKNPGSEGRACAAGSSPDSCASVMSTGGAGCTPGVQCATVSPVGATNNVGESKSTWQKTKDLFGQAMRSFGVFDMFVPSRASFENGASQLLGGPCDYNCEGHNASVKSTADVFEGAAQGVAEAGNRYYPELAKNVLLSALPELALAKGEVIVYRVFGGDARAQGFSWTTIDPRTVSNFRDAAGLPSGGASGATNTAEFLIKGRVNINEIIKSRSALPLDGNRGGLPELIIDPKKVRMVEFSVIKP